MLYVTGLTGHSGKWLLKRLEKEKYPETVRVVMRQSKEADPSKYEIFEHSPLKLEFAVGDLTDPSFLEKSLAGVDTLIHIASIHHSALLMNAAVKKQVRRAILVHTTGRFSKFKSASAEYIETEDAILTLRDQIDITVLRPTMIYGSSGDRNMYRLITYLARHRFFPLFGSGSNLMQPVHARDLGNAYYDVLMNPDKTRNKEYDLSGKKPITYRDIILCISRELNRKILLIPVPFQLSLLAAKLYNFLFRSRAIISVEQVLRMREDKAFSHEAAARDFGYNPVSFEEGIREEVQEFLTGKRVDFSKIRYQ